MPHVTLEKYIQSLQASHSGTSVMLKCNQIDIHSNGWNLDCPGLWRANIDFQYVANAHTAVMYVMLYMMKSEHAKCEPHRQWGTECQDRDIKEHIDQSGSAFVEKRKKCQYGKPSYE